MKVAIVSDVHCEFWNDDIPVPLDVDVVVLAGDVAVGMDSIELAGKVRAAGPRVVMVVGNHELYHQSFPSFTTRAKVRAGELDIDLLEKDEVVFGKARFLGTTLWTDFVNSPLSRPLAMKEAARCLNDFRLIRHDLGGRFTPEHSLIEHEASVRWLDAELEKPFDGKTVVVTHHAPLTQKTSAPIYDGSPLNGAFSSNLSGMFSQYPIDYWVFGHTHYDADFLFEKTRVVSRQRRYPHERPAGDQFEAMVIEI